MIAVIHSLGGEKLDLDMRRKAEFELKHDIDDQTVELRVDGDVVFLCDEKSFAHLCQRFLGGVSWWRGR